MDYYPVGYKVGIYQLPDLELHLGEVDSFQICFASYTKIKIFLKIIYKIFSNFVSLSIL